jgi:hypothetical protein
VTPADHAYLTDFGLARRSEDMTGITVQAQLLDSVDYVAPEYLGDGETDARSDIYSLGCVLYAALTGEVPYPRPGAPAKMYAHLSAELPSARYHRPEVSERLDAVVRRAMAKDPAERQQTAGEFAIETAGAVELSSPLWAMRAHPGTARHLDGAADGDFDPARHLDGAADGRFDPARHFDGAADGRFDPARQFDGGADGRVDPGLGRHDGEPQRHVDHGAPDGGYPRTLDPEWTGLDGDGGEEGIGQVDGSPVADHRRGSADGSAPAGAPEGPAFSADGYYEPVYFRRGRRRVRLLWALAIALFLAAPVALLIALTSHASAATPADRPVPALRSPHAIRAFKTLHQGGWATEWCAQRRSGQGGRLHVYHAGRPRPEGPAKRDTRPS